MKTLQKVRECFYSYNVRSDVDKCCRTCDPFTSRKGPKKRNRGRLQLYNVGTPFNRIAFHILGPLPRPSDDNNNYILVAMDYLTKESLEQEASTVSEVLVQHCILRIGIFCSERSPDAPLAPEKYIEKLQAWMVEMHHLARERIGMASEKMKTRYDARATGRDFHDGDKLPIKGYAIRFPMPTIFHVGTRMGCIGAGGARNKEAK
ncbi:retrovirus-related Pol polyprotein from transposon 412 [Trichonephila clavipes]|nr:retrovirus-related Pol polyprotein from transposon 412 [Trichonephila clavipes]